MRPLQLLAVVLLLAGPLEAGDPVEEGRLRDAQALLDELAVLRAERKKSEIKTALEKLDDIHNKLKSKPMRAKLQAEAGRVLKDDGLGAGARLLAAETLGKLNDPKGAYKQLKPLWPNAKDETVDPLPLSVVRSVGLLAPEAAIGPLVDLASKAKDPNAARYAIASLGYYGYSKSRTRVLKELATLLGKLKPGRFGGSGGRGSGEAARQRYQFLYQTIVSALNELTGRELTTPEEWESLYKQNKKKLEKLFVQSRR